MKCTHCSGSGLDCSLGTPDPLTPCFHCYGSGECEEVPCARCGNPVRTGDVRLKDEFCDECDFELSIPTS